MTMSLSRRLGPCKGSVAGLSLMAIMAGAVASAQAVQPGIHVEMLGIRNSTGAVACALFEVLRGVPHGVHEVCRQSHDGESSGRQSHL